LMNDDQKSSQFFECVKNDTVNTFFENHYNLGIEHAKQLTQAHATITKADIEALKNAGFSEGEVLEINQVTSYFNYVNRMVVGLGVNTSGDIVGLSPNNSDDPKNWSHD
jgi:alkylhydroperoxidase family enzyme